MIYAVDADDLDYSIPTVREVREQYLKDRDFVAFCLGLERAIAAYGLKETDLLWPSPSVPYDERNNEWYRWMLR